ncbi:MAG: flagellar brake protein [Motiliproteus sp.]
MIRSKLVPERFCDLNLAIGDSFSMESLSNNKRYPVKLIGLVESGSLIVSAPKIQGKEFFLPEGQILKVRLIAGKYACGFQTQVICSRRLPYLYSHLSYPSTFEAVAIRQANRVRLNLRAEISEYQTGTLHGDWPRKGLIMDVSSGGAKIHCHNPLAAAGSKLSICFTIEVDGVRKKVTIQAIVRNISELRDGYQYGVQFVDVTDEERVYISGFVYEQMLGRSE